jgi:adenylate cyclase
VEERLPRKLAAILYADVVGYSRMASEDEDATHRKLKESLDLIATTVKSYHGRVINYSGDAALAMFDAAVDAVSCAAAIQRDMVSLNQDVPDERKIQFRIGVNLGDVIEDGGDIFGDGVNVAARLEGLAEPGGICISDAVRTAVGKKLELIYKDLGEQGVKNIAEPVRAYKVVMAAQEELKTNDAVSPELELMDKPSIAVLPFDNMSGDAEQEYFADGISEDLITALSKIHWFFVIARNSSFTYKGHAVDVKQVAGELGVRYVIEGSVRKAGNRVRITAQLIDATTGRHVWAERYDRKLEDIFDLQDEMTQTIAGAVEPELSAVERDHAVRKPPENLGAWETYQRGLWHLWNFSKDDITEAQRLFRRVHELDPGFATPYAYEAYCHYLSVMLGFAEVPEKSLEEALTAAKKALALDHKDPVAYLALGRVYTMLGEHDASVAANEKSLELSPSSYLAYHGLGFALALSGRLEESAEALDKAIRLSPRDALLWGTMSFRSLTCILQQQYEDASDWAQKSILEPQAAGAGYWPYAVLASALSNLGQTVKAREAVEEALQRKPGLSLAFLETTLPTRQPDGLEPFLDGLHKAGLPD